jgi:hypothetical protein
MGKHATTLPHKQSKKDTVQVCTTHTITSCSITYGIFQVFKIPVKVCLKPDQSVHGSACFGTSSCFAAYFPFHTVSSSLFNSTSQSARLACADLVSRAVWRSITVKPTCSITLVSIRGVFIVGDNDSCYYCQEEDRESGKSQLVFDDEVKVISMMGKCGSVYCARPPPSTFEDPSTGQDLLKSKDVETYQGVDGTKGNRAHSAVLH